MTPQHFNSNLEKWGPGALKSLEDQKFQPSKAPD